jgi:hypothetical protein
MLQHNVYICHPTYKNIIYVRREKEIELLNSHQNITETEIEVRSQHLCAEKKRN